MLKCNGIKIFKTPSQASDINDLKNLNCSKKHLLYMNIYRTKIDKNIKN